MTAAGAPAGGETHGDPVTSGLVDVEREAREEPGFRLFTVLGWDEGRGALRRVHSSAPDAYPVGGEKIMPRDAPWVVQVLVQGRPYLGRDPVAVAAVFSDYALITSLGCGAVVNVPVLDGGHTLGVLNLLDSEGSYDEASVTAALPLATRSVPALRSWHASGRPSVDASADASAAPSSVSASGIPTPPEPRR